MPCSLHPYSKLFFKQKLTVSDQGVSLWYFEHEAHVFESAHRRSNSPHGAPLLAAAAVLKMMCTVVSLMTEEKRWKIEDKWKEEISTYPMIQSYGCVRLMLSSLFRWPDFHKEAEERHFINFDTESMSNLFTKKSNWVSKSWHSVLPNRSWILTMEIATSTSCSFSISLIRWTPWVVFASTYHIFAFHIRICERIFLSRWSLFPWSFSA